MVEAQIMFEEGGMIDFIGGPQPSKEVEIFPGVHERRYFLRNSLATVAAVIALGVLPRRVLA